MEVRAEMASKARACEKAPRQRGAIVRPKGAIVKRMNLLRRLRSFPSDDEVGLLLMNRDFTR